jgi:hypothetical protein
LDYILDNHRRYSQARQRGISRPPGMDTDQAAGAIKAMLLAFIGGDEESRYDFGEATYGDTAADSGSVYHGRNELRAELRAKLEQL